MWEKKASPEEEEKAKSLQLPPTFFCGLGATDSDTDPDKPEDFDTEVRQAQQELVKVFFFFFLEFAPLNYGDIISAEAVW